MSINSQSIASTKGVRTTETAFAVAGKVLPSRKLLSGGYDPAKTGIVAGRKYTAANSTRAAELFGYGSQMHRMAMYHELSAGGVPMDFLPLPAASGGTAATKTLTFATNATGPGTYYLRAGSYLAKELVKFSVATGATPAQAAAACVAEAAKFPNLPFTFAQGTEANAGVVTMTAKTADITSQDLRVTLNVKEEETEKLPAGMTATIAAGATGAGSSAITGLTAFLASETRPRYTSIVQPYTDTTTLDAVSAVLGNPNEATGCYDDLAYQPFSSFIALTEKGDTGFDNAIILGTARKEDCGTVALAAPDYPEVGYEIAAMISGGVDKQGIEASATEYTRLNFPYLFGPINPADDWTITAPAGGHAYDNRNAAVTAGITPIIFANGVVSPGDMTGTWHPDDNQNAPFKYVVNRIKIWNAQYNLHSAINGDGLKDRPIVGNAAATKRSEKAIDADTLRATIAQVVGIMADYAWIYEAEWTIANTTVESDSTNPDRFNFMVPIVLSGNNRVNQGEVQIDRNFASVNITLVA
jgi:phage tail sheath gpL-like